MNLVTYRGMPLMVMYANPWVREPILDESGATYLWTKWSCSLLVSYNPGSISAGPVTTTATPLEAAKFGGVAGPQNRTFMPATTDAAIRRFLEYPRGQLIVYSTDDGAIHAPDPTGGRQAFPRAPLGNAQPQGLIVLKSPADGMVCDANNGPFCKVNSIQEIAGERLWQIHLTFETYIYEDSQATTDGTKPVIVSNRWSESSDTNWQHLTTRIIEGIVHVRMDQLQARGSPNNQIDSLRSTFAAFTVPRGFQRESVQVRVLPQGNQCAYRIVDAEQLMQKTITSTQGVRLEVEEMSWMQKGSVGQAIASAINHGGARAPTLWETTPFGVIGYATEHARILAAAVFQQLPKRYKTVIVRAWGNRTHLRVTLTNLAVALARSRMGTAALIDTTTTETIVRYSSAQNMVEVQTTSRWSFADVGSLITGVPNVVAELFAGDGTPGIGDATLAGFIAQTADMQGLRQSGPNLAQPIFPNDNQTRGTWGPPLAPAPLDFLVSQALETIGQAPASPP